jgi:hypothetical protein
MSVCLAAEASTPPGSPATGQLDTRSTPFLGPAVNAGFLGQIHVALLCVLVTQASEDSFQNSRPNAAFQTQGPTPFLSFFRLQHDRNYPSSLYLMLFFTLHLCFQPRFIGRPSGYGLKSGSTGYELLSLNL